MKKIGKKLSYFTKLFLAIGLLFNNLSSLSIVFADEIQSDGDTQVVETTSNNGTTLGDDEDKTVVTPDEGKTDNTENVPAEEEETAVEPEELKFEVSVNDSKIIIKHNKALELNEESQLKVVEDFKYLDDTTYGNKENIIELTDEVRDALVSDEGYSFDSSILTDNKYAGEYSVNVYVDEDQAGTNKVIEAEGEGFEFKLYTSSGDEIDKDVEVYLIDKDTSGFTVSARLLNGGISPSDKVMLDEEEVNASELFEERTVAEETLEGYLNGQFIYNFEKDYTLNGEDKKVSEEFNIMYGMFQDNTDRLNESAKNVELDSKYIFVGNNFENTVYALSNEEVEEILKDFVGEDGIVTYEVNTENGLEIILTDGRVTVYYEGTNLSTDSKIDARLETDSEEISSGDTFTVKYIVNINEDPINGFSGLVKYDEELLKLTNIESSVLNGNSEDERFLYAEWKMLQADFEEDEEGNITNIPKDYVLVTLTFEALKAGEANISIDDAKFYQRGNYFEASGEITTSVLINESEDNTLASLKVAGQEIQLEDGVLEYEITVANDVTDASVEAILNNNAASITSMVYPEELAEGENTITIVVMAENGDEKIYTIKVTREASQKEEEATVAPMAYNDNNYRNDDNDTNDDNKIVPADQGEDKNKDDDNKKEEKENNLSRIIIIILILLVIAGLIYLIFKDDSDEEEKKTNKDINRLKKDDSSFDRETKKVENKSSPQKNNHNRNNKNNKKGR